jgi:hypothetical protein
MTINPKRIGMLAFDASIHATHLRAQEPGGLAFDASIAAARHQPAVRRTRSTGQRPAVRVGHIAFPYCGALAAVDNGRVTYYGQWAVPVTHKKRRFLQSRAAQVAYRKVRTQHIAT